MSSFTKTEAGRAFALGIETFKRIAGPGDIAGAVALLASDDARWITAQTIHADGAKL